MKPNEAPQALKDDFFVSYVGHQINESDTVKRELYEVSFASGAIQIVTYQVTSVLQLLLTHL